jgi:hypothetical protein
LSCVEDVTECVYSRAPRRQRINGTVSMTTSYSIITSVFVTLQLSDDTEIGPQEKSCRASEPEKSKRLYFLAREQLRQVS